MFKKANNIDTAFKQVKLIALVSIIATTGISAFIVYQNNLTTKDQQDKVIVLANGQVVEAIVSDRKANLEVEAKNHIKTFHQLFFTLSPDDKQITRTISKALYLADHSAKRQYDNLRESNYYTGIIAGNISQAIEVDSVYLDINTSPYAFRCYATQEITRPTSLATRKLITQGALREVMRSENNPHGFLIERWQVIANTDINVRRR